MSFILQVFCSLFSGLLLAMAIPNEFILYGSPVIALVSAAPLYIAINTAKSYKKAFLLCFLQAAFCHLLSSFWLGNFRGFAAFTLGASDIGTGFILGFTSLFLYFPVLFSHRSDRLKFLSGLKPFEIPLRVFWFAAVYTVYEWCKSTGFLAYPWGTLSMTALRWPVISQIADITGCWGITFLFAFISALTGEGILLISELTYSQNKKQLFIFIKNTALCCSALFLISFVYGIHQISKERKITKTLNTILIQQNNDSWARNEKDNIHISQRLSEEARNNFSSTTGESIDLIVWSEAVLSKRFPNAESYYNYYPEEEPLIKFIKRMNVPFIIGGPYTLDADKGDYGNSALFFDRTGKFKGKYTKMHLVPFAELIPGRQNEKVRAFVKKNFGSYGWAPGKKVVIFEIPLKSPQPEKDEEFETVSLMQRSSASSLPSLKFSTPICFDDSAIEVCRAMFLDGTELFVNITNDSWSKTKSAEIQHLAVARYRSIEFRIPTIRAANAGYTCVIGPDGRILENLNLFEEGALTSKVNINQREMTFFARYGNWLPELFSILAFIFIIWKLNQSKIQSEDDRNITTLLLPESLEWYETRDRIMELFPQIYAIDWNNWNM